MACVQDNLSSLSGQSMEADVCLVDHVPSTTHSAHVNIREFDDSVINPDPVIQNEDTEQLMEDYLSPQKLKSLTGIQELGEVAFLEMVVNTTENSLGNFGNMVQNLKQLKLSNSIISSVRDLGTCLNDLQTLWMAKCGLCDLDGISSLSSIKELYLAYNNITDVSPVSMLDNLEILDLEGNLVGDMAQVEFLVLCPELKRLTLEGNPVCMKPHPDCLPETLTEYNYRVEVHKLLPKLKYLDDEPFLFDLVNGTRVLKITPTQQQNSSLREKLKSDWELVTERIKSFDEEEESSEENNLTFQRPGSSRPTSASRQRPSTARPGTARQRPGTAGQRPGTAQQRPGTASGPRPSTAIGENMLFEEDDSSDLTHGLGAVICGNPSRALKARRKNLNNSEVNRLVLDPSSTLPDELEPDLSVSERDLFEELKSWRREYARFLDKGAEKTIIEDDEDEDIPVDESYPDHTLTSSPTASLSPTPPRRPISSSPPSSASLRRRVARIRNSYPLPTPPDDSDGRPRTAADFRNRITRNTKLSRLRASSDNLRESAEQSVKKDLELGTDEPRASSAPANSTSPRCLPSLKDVRAPVTTRTDPVISASRELYKPSVDPRLIRRVRPASARLASHKTKKFQ